jgi:NADH-quinone oxidoreductase subunit K
MFRYFVAKQFATNLCLFLIGLMGLSFNRSNVLLTLFGIELMLLSSTLNFTLFSSYHGTNYGQIFGLFILTVAAAESAVGLAILITAYKLRGTINILDDRKEPK